MARRKRVPKARFEDMPPRLRFKAGQSPKVVADRAVWLAEHDLALVDYFGWLYSQTPQAPARRIGPLPPDVQELVEDLEQSDG